MADIKQIEPDIVSIELGPTTSVQTYGRDSLTLAASFYRRDRARLEEQHYDQYVRIDVASGAHVVGATRREASERFTERFGPRIAYTFHIGTTYRNEQ